MTIFEAFFLGIFQGITEFLPISSSGHLVLAEHYFKLPADELVAFDAFLHGGTLLAIMILFWKDIRDILLIPFSKNKKSELRFLLILVAATIPAGIIGFLFEDWFTSFRSVTAVAVSFVLTGILFIIAEKFPAKKTAQIGWRAAIFAGILQVISLLPGVSRSGITLAGGMLAGAERTAATRFSFFLSMPITAGVVTLYMSRLVPNTESVAFPPLLPSLVAFVTAVIIGYLTARFLLQYFRRHSLAVFSVYLIVSGFALLVIEYIN